jgi:hypothetical protein
VPKANMAKAGTNVLRSRYGRAMEAVEDALERVRMRAEGLISDADTHPVLRRMNLLAACGRTEIAIPGGFHLMRHLDIGGVCYCATTREIGDEMLIVFQPAGNRGAAGRLRRVLACPDAGGEMAVFLHDGGVRIASCAGEWRSAVAKVLEARIEDIASGASEPAPLWEKPVDWVPFAISPKSGDKETS